MPLCTATAKSTQKPCGNDAMHGTNVCHKHGGPGALKNLKHGGYSKNVLKRKAGLPSFLKPYETDLPRLQVVAGQIKVVAAMIEHRIQSKESLTDEDASYFLKLTNDFSSLVDKASQIEYREANTLTKQEAQIMMTRWADEVAGLIKRYVPIDEHGTVHEAVQAALSRSVQEWRADRLPKGEDNGQD